MSCPTYIKVLCALLLIAYSLQARPSAQLPSPLTLEQALEYALQNNPQLNIVKQQLSEQKGLLVQATARALPSVTANAAYSQIDANLQETAAQQALGRKDWQADVTISQTIFAGGAVAQGIRASYANTQAAKARFTSQVQTTLYSVKEAFYRVLVDRQIVAVRQETLQVLEEQLKNVEARYNAGVASEFERLQAQVALANERPLLVRARNDYRVAADSLLAVLGTPATTSLNPDDISGELTPKVIPIELEALLNAAQTSRADIRAANRDFAAAQSAVWAARAEYLPSVSAFGAYNWQKSSLSSRMRDDVDGWTAGVQASWPIFNGFAREAKIASAKARRRQASAADLQTRLNVAVEVRQSFSLYEQAREILSSAEQVVAQARESLRMAKARYEAGSSTQLDVLQAQSAFSQARLSQLEAQYDTIISLALLQKATGTSAWLPSETPRS
jgi:outer membrane protein